MDIAIGWNRFNLSLLGVWPEPRKTSRGTRVTSSLLFWTTSFVMFSFICVPQTAYMILNSSSLDETIQHLSTNVPVIFALVKQLALRYHGKDLTWLMNEILKDWNKPTPESDLRVMLKHGKLSRKISIGCSCLAHLTVSAFIFLQIWNNIYHPVESNLGGLMHPSSFPYDTKRSPHYQITFAGQFVGYFLVGLSYSCFDTFVALLVLHLCGQLRVLRLALENLAETTREKNFAKFYQRVGFIVYRHNQLHRYATTVEECFNLMLLIQTIISTAMFCLTGYRMITSVNLEEKELPMGTVYYVSHVIYTMMHLFIHCYMGETLLGESFGPVILNRRDADQCQFAAIFSRWSTGVAESTYVCNWYDLPPKKAVSLGIIICRGRIPFDITAGKFSPFSLALFNTILKTSAGYLSVLLAVNEQIVTEE